MKPGNSLRVIGVGAAACVACCAAPILAFLTAAGLLSIALIGTAGLVLAVLAFAGRLLVGRRRAACPVPAEAPVPVAAPTRRLSDFERSTR